MYRMRDLTWAGLLLLAALLPCQPASAYPSTELVSANGDEVRGDQPSLFASISEDGRFVAFSSRATNLVPNDLNGAFDIFIRDRLDRHDRAGQRR